MALAPFIQLFQCHLVALVRVPACLQASQVNRSTLQSTMPSCCPDCCAAGDNIMYPKPLMVSAGVGAAAAAQLAVPAGCASLCCSHCRT